MTGRRLPETVEELAKDPKKFGLPTFEEFARNPDKWRLAKDWAFQAADGGSKNIKNARRMVYKIGGYTFRSLERVQDYCDNEGISYRKLKMRPEVRQDVSAKYYIEVTFEVPDEARKTRIIGA